VRLCAVPANSAQSRIWEQRGRYTIILFRDGGEGSGIEGVVDSDDLIHTAHALYQRAVMKRPGRLLMLCDRLHVLARNDRPDAVPR
jgi:hypothetical protein